MELLRQEIPLLYAIINTLWEILSTASLSGVILAAVCCIVCSANFAVEFGG